MTLSPRIFTPSAEVPEPPQDFAGTWPEYVCYREIIRQGYVEGEDFTLQSYKLGGRLHVGGLVIDFVFDRPPGIAIEVNGVYYHYQRGPEQKGRDIIKRGQMASLGYSLIFIDDVNLLADPEYYVTQALQGVDHSELQV